MLAAGLGRRLGDATARRPKAVLEVAGEPLVSRALRFARLVGCDHRVVVAGYGAEEVHRCVERVDPEAIVVTTPTFDGGNVLTLETGYPALQAGGFLLMNVDHIYGDAIADLVRAVADEATEVTAFVDFDRPLGADDMKVELVQGRAKRMSKTLDKWDAGYVGMTFVPARRRARYETVLSNAVAEHGEGVNVEQLLNDLSEAGVPAAVADISGVGWWEVDDARDRAVAEEALRDR